MANLDKYNTLCKDTYNRFLESRNMYYLLSTHRFEAAWEDADEQEQKVIFDLVKEGDVAKVKKFLDTILKEDLANKTVLQLRRVAIEMGYSGVSKFTKTELLSLTRKKA